MSNDQFEAAIKLPPKRLPAMIKQELAHTPSSAALERAKQALAECLTFDQAKEIADEARAVARYATEKKDCEELLRMARQIQVRAYRRMGELLRNIGRKFSVPSTEGVAIRIAGMDQSRFEQALAKDSKGLSPHEFIRAHLPSPPPVYSNDPEDVARRQRRFARNAASIHAEVVRSALGHFHGFSKSIAPANAASLFSRGELSLMRRQVVECQEWLDAFELLLPKTRRS